MTPTFAEWQSQQGGGAGAPSPGGAPSFAEWQAQQGGGSPAGAAPPPADHAPYDWLQAYEAATSNVYGDQSQDVLQRVIADAGPDYQKAKDAGIIGPDGLVDWSKAPKPVASASGNTMYGSVGERGGFVDPWSLQPTKSLTGSYINDPNYGMQALVQKRAPNSPEMNALRAGAMAMAMAPVGMMLGPAIASGLGTSPAVGSALGNMAISSGSTLAQGGKINPGSLAGAAIGTTAGIPMGGYIGGTAGGMLANAAQGKRVSFNPVSAGMTFAQWLASQGGK